MQGDSPGNARGDQDLSESVLDNFTQDDQPGQYMRSIETPAAEFYDQVKQQRLYFRHNENNDSDDPNNY